MSRETRTVYWTIDKAQPSAPVLSKTSLNIDSPGITVSFTVAREGDGRVYAKSSDPSIVRVYVWNETSSVADVECTSVKEGSVDITVTVGEGTNYTAYTGTEAVCHVTYQNVYNVVRVNEITTPFPAYEAAATSVGDYALFGGGTLRNGAPASAVVAFYRSTSISSCTGLNYGQSRLAAATVGNYAIFAGGYVNSMQTVVNYADAYNASLTKKGVNAALSVARCDLAAATVGNYALFAGGRTNDGVSDVVDVYDDSLTKITSPAIALSYARSGLAAAAVGNYALFGNGLNANGGVLTLTDAYDASLTKYTGQIYPMNSNQATKYASATIGGRAFFGGGWRNGGTIRVTGYDASLTRANTTMAFTRGNLAAASIGSYAVFGGGRSTTEELSPAVETFNASGTRGIATDLSAARYDLAAATVGNYALFAGGRTNDGVSDVVDVYQAAS